MQKERTGQTLVICRIYIYVTGLRGDLMYLITWVRPTHSFLMTAAVNSEVVEAPRNVEQ